MRIFRRRLSATLTVVAAAMLLAACAADRGAAEKTGKRDRYGNGTRSVVSAFL